MTTGDPAHRNLFQRHHGYCHLLSAFWTPELSEGLMTPATANRRRHWQITDTQTESHLHNKSYSQQSYTEFQHHRQVFNLTTYFHKCNANQLQTKVIQIIEVLILFQYHVFKTIQYLSSIVSKVPNLQKKKEQISQIFNPRLQRY